MKGADEITREVYRKDVVGEMIAHTIIACGRSVSRTAYQMGTDPETLLKEAQKYELTHLFEKENS
ncbi:hypothetical protein KY306_00915 [Candidatus Woesearchaeota archaeon]|nr:hypothetical protein [Candidatus Woesearchaeota archaeon]